MNYNQYCNELENLASGLGYCGHYRDRDTTNYNNCNSNNYRNNYNNNRVYVPDADDIHLRKAMNSRYW